jgi:hypothetical protein
MKLLVKLSKLQTSNLQVLCVCKRGVSLVSLYIWSTVHKNRIWNE